MKNKDIIKALNTCVEGMPCRDCPLEDKEDCKAELLRWSQILANEQDAEIEKLQHHIVGADKKVREFAKLLVDKSKDGAVPVSDLPDLVYDFLKGSAEE